MEPAGGFAFVAARCGEAKAESGMNDETRRTIVRQGLMLPLVSLEFEVPYLVREILHDG
jgi:hypothetical protein